MTVRVFLFDLDGTLVDTAPDLVRATNLVRTDRGLPALPDKVLRPMASKGAPGLIETAFSITPEDSDFPALKREFLTNYQRDLAQASLPFDGITDLLDQLRAQGMMTGIFTNKYIELADSLIDRLHLRRYFDLILGSNSEGCAMKPAPDAFFRAAELLNVPPQEMLYAGDDPRDVIAAHAAGLRCAAVRWGYLDSDPKTWNADFIADTPQDLLNWATRLK